VTFRAVLDLPGACLSGAAPSAAAIVRRNAHGAARTIAEIYRQEGGPGTMRVQHGHQLAGRR